MSRLHCSGVLPFVPNQKWGFEVYWIDDKIEVIWLVFLTYFSIFQWQKSRNPAGCEYRAWVISTGKMRSMHILFIRILPIFVFIIGHFQSEFSFATDSVYQICFKAQIACRRGANIPCPYAPIQSCHRCTGITVQSCHRCTGITAITVVTLHPAARCVAPCAPKQYPITFSDRTFRCFG